MGRLKKTAEEKRLSGNPGRREIPDDPAVEPILDAKPSDDFTDAQKKYWNLYAPYMVKNKLLTDLNRTDLERLCRIECEADHIFMEMSLKILPQYQEKKNYHGEPVDIVESIYSKTFRNYCTIIRNLKADLRIRTDKLRVTVKEKPTSKFEGLLNGAGK